MASFNDHINQAKKNISTFCAVNAGIPDSWDWQVTMLYYAAVHLVNAHIAKRENKHFQTHNRVKNAIYSGPCALPQNVYLAYVKLERLSRRARYLCHEKTEGVEMNAHFTHSLHLSRSVKNLDEILVYFRNAYGIRFDDIHVDCIDLKNATLSIFKYGTRMTA